MEQNPSSNNHNQKSKIINSLAPIRICDNGGWTDTWFARRGKIFNIAVSPYAEVQIMAQPKAQAVNQVVLHVENFGDHYRVQPGRHWDRHPLLEAAIEYMQAPQDLDLEISIYSAAPSGASAGTSAAVTVALVGALDCLTPGRMTPHEAAYAAQRIETGLLGQQSGIQDQLASAYGGINYIEMDEYPLASVCPIRLSDETWWELERRLALVFLGKTHHSSQVHELVIRELEGAGPDCKQLNDLRQTAEKSRDALIAGDFAGLGEAMAENTAAQRRLHPALVSAEAAQVIEIARRRGALGWKVNGAGGEGGSLTILSGEHSGQKRRMLGEIEAENPLYKVIPIQLSRTGLRVWVQE
jgi:D-glycero-alpha-D-manno-heptose-7-phosphate kinase